MIITNKDNRISNFETFGDSQNPAIVLIHGLGAELSSWSSQIEILKKEGYYIITPDMYGHGKSSDLISDDLIEWNLQLNELISHLKIEKFIICGVSMGGVIAQNYAVENPDKISAIVISDSFGELKTFSEKLLGFSQIIGFKIFRILGNKFFAKGMASAYKETYAIAAKEYMYNQSLIADFNQLLNARRAINKVNTLNKLKKLNIPSLIVVGECFGTGFVNINKKISDSFRDSKFVVLKESMDPSPMVNSESFNMELIQFLLLHNLTD